METYILPLESYSYVVYRLTYRYSCLWAAILDFSPPIASYIIKNSFVEFFDLENMGVAVGILHLSCVYVSWVISISGFEAAILKLSMLF